MVIDIFCVLTANVKTFVLGVSECISGCFVSILIRLGEGNELFVVVSWESPIELTSGKFGFGTMKLCLFMRLYQSN